MQVFCGIHNTAYLLELAANFNSSVVFIDVIIKLKVAHLCNASWKMLPRYQGAKTDALHAAVAPCDALTDGSCCLSDTYSAGIHTVISKDATVIIMAKYFGNLYGLRPFQIR